MIAAYNDWELGITPVSTGAAPWLPAVYREGVQAVRESVAAERRAKAELEQELLALKGKG